MIAFSETRENERVINLVNNNRVYLRREDPYGFWRISFEKGQIPKVLSSSFTSVDEALKKVEAYLNTKGKEVVKAYSSKATPL